MSESLRVPDEAVEAMIEHGVRYMSDHDWDRAGREIAAPVVVAELRRLAREYEKARREGREMVLVSTALRRRAAELERSTS